jgi:hypothetical protein
MVRVLLVVAVLAMTASLAPAAPAPVCDLVAAPGGADENPGTLAKPLRTAQALIDDPSPSRKRCLRGGTYDQWAESSDGQLTFSAGGSPGDPLRLQSYPGERAHILGVLSMPRTIGHIVLQDLDIDGGHVGGASVTVQAQGDDVTLDDVDVTNGGTGQSCVTLGRAHAGESTGAVVRDSRLHGCGADPLHDHGVYVEATEGALVTGNRIYGNAGWGVHMYPDAQNSVIAYNAIDGNGRGVLFGGQAPLTSNGNVVEHNAISRSTLGHNLESYWGDNLVGTGNIARENCLGGAAAGDVEDPVLGYSLSANVTADPDYEHDFRISADSLCHDVLAVATPGAPGAVDGVVTWSPSPFAIGYVLERRDGDDAAWSPAPGTSLSATVGGTWRFRVKALGPLADSGMSPASVPVKVDRIAPPPPRITADRAPEAPPWFRDRVTLRFSPPQDPRLPDGTLGTGVDPASVPQPVAGSRTGTVRASGRVADRAGNASPLATLTVPVDAGPPVVTLRGCPPDVRRGTAASIDVSASDAGSGLALDPSGRLALATDSAGPQTTTVLARDRVGHTTTAACAYRVTEVAVDFNGDGVPDRAAGRPRRRARGLARAGVVLVRYGGLRTRRIDQTRAGGRSEHGDRFGAAIATGDLDGDGFTDLAVGTPREDVGRRRDAGAVNVLFGSPHGLRRARQITSAVPRRGARFGARLAVRDGELISGGAVIDVR